MPKLPPLELVLKAQDQISGVVRRADRGVRGFTLRAKRNAEVLKKGFLTVRQAVLGLQGAIFGLLSAGVLGAFVTRAIDSAEALDKMSQRVGVAVEDLSTLGFAAKKSGSSLEELELGLKGFAKRVEKVSSGAASGALETAQALESVGVKVKAAGGEAAKAFNKLGIEVRDTNTGAIKPTAGLLLEVADRFQGMEDGAEKAALAQALFEESGVRLIPLLNQGSAGISRLQQEARDLGAEISTNTAKRAAEFKDNLDELKAAADGAALELADDLLPFLTEVTEAFSDGAKQGGLLAGAVRSATEAWVQFRAAAFDIEDIDVRIEDVRSAISETIQELNAARRGRLTGSAGEFFTGADPEENQKRIDRLVRQKDRLLVELKDLQTQRRNTILGPKAGGGFGPDAFSEGDFDGVLGSGSDPGIDGQGDGGVSQADLDAAFAERAAREQEQAREALQRDLEQRRIRAEALREQAEMFRADEFERLEIARSRELELVRGFEEAELEIVRKFERLKTSARINRHEAIVSAENRQAKALLSIGQAFGLKNENLQKALDVAMAIRNTSVGVTKALATLPPPLSFKVAAATRLEGAAQVATILATSAFGGGAGGVPAVGSGSGAGGASVTGPTQVPSATETQRTEKIVLVDLRLDALDPDQAWEKFSDAFERANEDGRTEVRRVVS